MIVWKLPHQYRSDVHHSCSQIAIWQDWQICMLYLSLSIPIVTQGFHHDSNTINCLLLLLCITYLSNRVKKADHDLFERAQCYVKRDVTDASMWRSFIPEIEYRCCEVLNIIFNKLDFMGQNIILWHLKISKNWQLFNFFFVYWQTNWLTFSWDRVVLVTKASHVRWHVSPESPATVFDWFFLQRM